MPEKVAGTRAIRRDCENLYDGTSGLATELAGQRIKLSLEVRKPGVLFEALREEQHEVLQTTASTLCCKQGACDDRLRMYTWR